MPHAVTIDFGSLVLTPLAPGEAKRRRVKLAPNQSLPAGTLLAESLATPGLYAAFGGAGLSGPLLVLETACATDALGNVNLGATTPGTMVNGSLMGGDSPAAMTFTDANAFWALTCRCEDIPNRTRAALLALGRIIEGDWQSGVFRMP